MEEEEAGQGESQGIKKSYLRGDVSGQNRRVPTPSCCSAAAPSGTPAYGVLRVKLVEAAPPVASGPLTTRWAGPGVCARERRTRAAAPRCRRRSRAGKQHFARLQGQTVLFSR